MNLQNNATSHSNGYIRLPLVYFGAFLVSALILGIVTANRIKAGVIHRSQPGAKRAPELTQGRHPSSFAADGVDTAAPAHSVSASEALRPNAWLSAAPLRRSVAMSPEAMAPYETILASLDIPPNGLRRLKELIVERAESASDADDLGREKNLSAQTTLAARREAEAALDRQLVDVVGPAKIGTIREMLELTPQLTEIAHFVERPLSSNGTPLSAETMLSLAEIYRDAYVGPPTCPPVDRTAGCDPETGLGQADRQVLAYAAIVLSPMQLETLRRILAKTAARTPERKETEVKR